MTAIHSQSPTVVFSQNKCKFLEAASLTQSFAEIGAPVLNELVDKGELMNWGILEQLLGNK